MKSVNTTSAIARRRPLRRGDALAKLVVARFRRDAVALRLAVDGDGDVRRDLPENLARVGDAMPTDPRALFSPSAWPAARIIASVTRRAPAATMPSPMAGKM
jgi:hypothetical protein